MILKIRWSDEEINYLKNNYSKMCGSDIQESLNNIYWNERSMDSIRFKAFCLGLKRYKK